MEDRFTSLELSKRLKDAGCKLESEKTWRIYSYENKEDSIELWDKKDGCIVRMDAKCLELVPAFDLLNDICCKYAHTFFGDRTPPEMPNSPAYIHEPKSILHSMILGWSKKEVEAIIWENCLFNKSNKR